MYLGFLKFYQPKATGSGFLIFEWTLRNFYVIRTNATFFTWT
jgi:hypothetical protein